MKAPLIFKYYSHFINLYLCCKYLMILLVCFIRLLPLVERLIHFGWGFQIRLQCLDAPIKLDISAQRSQLSMNFQIASEESLWSDIYDSVCTNSKTAGPYVSSMRDMIAFQIMRVDICKTNWWITLKHRKSAKLPWHRNVNLHFYLSVFWSIHLFIFCLFFFLFVFFFFFLSIHLLFMFSCFVFLFFGLFIYSSINLFVFSSIHIFVFWFFHLFIFFVFLSCFLSCFRFVFMSICLYVVLSFCQDITLIKCLKGLKSLLILKWRSVSQWRPRVGIELSGQLKFKVS